MTPKPPAIFMSITSAIKEIEAVELERDKVMNPAELSGSELHDAVVSATKTKLATVDDLLGWLMKAGRSNDLSTSHCRDGCTALIWLEDPDLWVRPAVASGKDLQEALARLVLVVVDREREKYEQSIN